MYKVLHMAHAGGLDLSQSKVGQFMDSLERFGASELLNLVKDQPEVPYTSFGGYNITAIANSYERDLKTLLFRDLRKAGGDDLVNAINRGDLEADVIRIRHYVESKLDEAQRPAEQQNKVMEAAKENLEVSEDAWKVFDIFWRVMDLSQRLLGEAGFHRPPRKAYIGSRSIYTKTVVNTTEAKFVEDLASRSNMNRSESLDIYRSFGESTRFPSNWQVPISDLTEFLQKRRKIHFNTPQDEMDFMDIYGKVPRGGTTRAYSVGGIEFGTGSNLMAGVISSIDSDSRIAGVVSVMGNRPFLLLELASSMLSRKYSKLLDEKGMKGYSARIKSGIYLSKSHFDNVLQDMILGQTEAFGYMPQFRKTTIAMTNMRLLKYVSITSIFADTLTSVAHLFNFVDNPALAASRFLWHRFRLMRKEELQQIAGRMNIVITAQTRDYARRLYGDRASGIFSWAENTVMGMTGVGRVTDAGKAANMVVMGMWLSDAFRVPFNQLKPRTQTVLGTHRIDARTWDYIRNLPDTREAYTGVETVFIDRLRQALQKEVLAKKITQETADELFLNYDTFISEHAQVKSIPQQDIYTRAHWDFNASQPDSVSHNFGKFISQYKPIITVPNTPLSLIHI